MNVFEKLHEASQNASGVDLTELDVHLLLETAGDAIFDAEAGNRPERAGTQGVCAATIDGTAVVLIDRTVHPFQLVPQPPPPKGGRGGRGTPPPASPCRGPAKRGPKG